jgi:uncharacterized repeat protein (TIGR01451 family)
VNNLNLKKMNKLLKKFSSIVLVSSLLAIVIPSLALADAKPEFNTSSSDNPLIRVKNITQGESEYKTSTSAKAGDTLRFNLWIHNNVENSTAQNVVARVVMPSSASTSQTVSAIVSATNADSVNGSLVVTLNEKGQLKYVTGSTLAYSDVYGSGHKWPNDALVGEGTNVGSLKGCWPYTLQITFEAKVNQEEVPEEIKLSLQKQVSYGDARKDGNWYDAISKDTKKFGAGEYLYHRITVKNTGSAVVKSVKLEDRLPSFLYWTGGDGKYKSGEGLVIFDLGDIASGATNVLEYQLRVKDTLPNGERTQENVVIARSTNYQDLQDSTVVWIKGPDTVETRREEVEIVTTRVEKVEKEVIEKLPDTGSSALIPNLLISLGSLITGFGLKKLER